MASFRVMTEVCSVQGEEERGEYCSLWGPRATDYHLRHTVPQPHILGSPGEVVNNPRGQLMVHSRSLQLIVNKNSLLTLLCSNLGLHMNKKKYFTGIFLHSHELKFL